MDFVARPAKGNIRYRNNAAPPTRRRINKRERSVIDPRPIKPCRLAQLSKGQALRVARQTGGPALTDPARAGLRQYAVGAGESLRRGRTRERGQEERKIERGLSGDLTAGVLI